MSKKWTPEEIAMIMSPTRPTIPELAKQLGRSVSSIDNKRRVLLGSKKSTPEAIDNWKKQNPERAKETMKKWHREHHDHMMRESLHRQKSHNEESKDEADQHMMIWDAHEDALVLDYTYSARELATMLGRTYYAVRARRFYLNHLEEGA